VGNAYTQEKPESHIPDTNRTAHEHIYVPSMSPVIIFTLPETPIDQLSLSDRFMIDSDARFNPYGESWKRSFLIGASSYQAPGLQISTFMSGKQSFFQSIQVALGVAELAGVAYLGYKAIKKEPITKKK